MVSLIERLRTLTLGESIYERFEGLGIGEYRGEREATKRFLAHHGEKIPSLESIAERGDLIAVIDGWGGFVAFVTNGFARTNAIESPIRRLYDPELNPVGSLVGEVVSVRLKTPEWFYIARLHRENKSPFRIPEDIDENNEVWYRSPDIPTEAFKIVPKIVPRRATIGWALSSRDIRDGEVYRLTSPQVIERIKSNVPNVMTSSTFYYINPS